MKRLISLAVAVMLITLLGVCRSRAYDEYNLTDLAACSSVKVTATVRADLCAHFREIQCFQQGLCPIFLHTIFCRWSDKECVTERKLHLCTCFDDAFTNKYSVYSLNLNNGNVSQNTFVDENFMTNSFSVTDNRIYYIKTDSLKSYVACRDFHLIKSRK